MIDLAIIRQALSRAEDPSSFQDLSTALGFQAEDHPINFLGDPASEIHGRVSQVADGLYRVGSFSSPTGEAGFWTANLLEWGERSSDRDKARRRITKALVELEPAGDRRVLVALVAPVTNDIELILPRPRTDGSLGTIRATVNRTDPSRYHLELLRDLELNPGMTAVAIARRWNESFNVDKVAKRFYIEFRNLRNRVLEELYQANPNSKLIQDHDRKNEVRRYVTRNLGRVLFLWFIQSKGWLDKDRSYFVNLYENRCRNHEGHNYFCDTLVPLFFEALARKKAQRSDAAKSLGDVAFLNGGLFLQDRFEDELYGEEREHLDIKLPNYLFDPRQHAPDSPTVLGLLNSYRFTTRESTPDDQSVDPDPELLGKVFENLNEESERAESGTFYTPREVVRFMCREALDGYLAQKTGCDKATLDWLRAEALDPSISDRRMPAKEREEIHKALNEVTVCDPAVGSGAFPVGMMQEILQLKRGLEQSADVMLDIGGQKVAEWKEHIITNCLYGVDINPEAIEICHLRLWLSLVIDANEPVPLPNLDFRFVAGDSLVDRLGTERLYRSLPKEQTQINLSLGALEELPRIEKEIQTHREEFTNVETPSVARRLREQIRKKQIKAIRIQIEARLIEVQKTLKEAQKKLARLVSLGAKKGGLKGVEGKINEFQESVELFEKLRESLSPWSPYKKPFVWPIEFTEVFEQGGFDIVVANPPYVRQESLSAEDQETYKAEFIETYTGTADLYVYFYQRAHQILKDDGQLVFITSNSFTKRTYGKKLQGFLATKLSINQAIDFGELKVFDAAVEPYVLAGVKKIPSKEHRIEGHQLFCVVSNRMESNRGSVSAVREQLGDLESLLKEDKCSLTQVRFHRAGWRLEGEEIIDLFERLKGSGTPLGQFVKERMYRGILTGLNEAFVINQAKRDELIAADPKSSELIKPWLSGKDVGLWSVNWPGTYCIHVPWTLDLTHYPAIKKHLQEYKTELSGRPELKKGLYPWYAMSRWAAEYFHEFERPKAVWKETNRYFCWGIVDPGVYLNKTIFFIPDCPLWLLAVVSSKWHWFLLAFQQSTGIGGFLCMQREFVQGLPVPLVPGQQKKDLGNLMKELLSTKQVSLAEYWESPVHSQVALSMSLTENDQKAIEKWFLIRSLVNPGSSEVVKEANDD